MEHYKIEQNDYDSTIAVGECKEPVAAKGCHPLSKEAKHRFCQIAQQLCNTDATVSSDLQHVDNNFGDNTLNFRKVPP